MTEQRAQQYHASKQRAQPAGGGAHVTSPPQLAPLHHALQSRSVRDQKDAPAVGAASQRARRAPRALDAAREVAAGGSGGHAQGHAGHPRLAAVQSGVLRGREGPVAQVSAPVDARRAVLRQLSPHLSSPGRALLHDRLHLRPPTSCCSSRRLSPRPLAGGAALARRRRRPNRRLDWWTDRRRLPRIAVARPGGSIALVPPGVMGRQNKLRCAPRCDPAPRKGGRAGGPTLQMHLNIAQASAPARRSS